MKHIIVFVFAVLLMLPVSGCSNEDSYADLDGKNMSPKERSEICTSVKDSKQCNDLSFNVGCGYPSEFKSICFRDGECIVETVPSYCMDTLSQTNNAVQTPSTIIYKRGEADSLFFPYTIDPYGWSRCLSYKEGDPEFCKCADGTMERVEGSCP